MFENLRPICDLCAHEHGPPQLSRLLKEYIVADDATAEDHIRRLVFQKAGPGRLRPGDEVPLKTRSVHAWAAPTSRLEAGAPSTIEDARRRP